ncbi:hypothetical protein PHAVU_008G184600 [Phaseolus vulgaris]|uniref:PB1 domain-containing protein n=1 Tax=Phaseolus vulgaris TaxID=3885 RepID=V7B675_PHAVU|nr:hypothetical protein PHAVU_008G184600g [Phaseolus vulgaris]ESW13299.1 hypothetical protein PHAVU_008G184600g [Phaseolus vulgaris]
MDSRDSSPRSRDPDADNHHHSFDDPPPSLHSKVKLMCSYGGRIQPRPHDNHLTYVAGDTKILTVDRHIKLPALLTKLSSLANAPANATFFKYQLPGEDLDALISVTNDEDLHHMMLEYDRLSRASPRPARLRLFLFPLHNNNSNINFALTDSKPERQWFVDALNSVQVPLLEGSPPPPTAAPNPDFLFGLDKPPPAPEAPPKTPSPESECFSEDRPAVRDTETETGTGTERVLEPEIRRLQIGNNNEQLLQRKMKLEEDNNGRVNGAEGFSQTNTENVTPLVSQGFHSGTVSFLQERNNVGYSFAVPTTGSQIYLIQTPSGIFQAVRPVTGPVGQPVYLVPAPSSVGVAAERGYSAGQGGARW